jgi:hypothetical protein
MVWTTALVASSCLVVGASWVEWSLRSVDGILLLRLGTVSGNVACLRAVVTTGTLGLLGTVTLNVTDTTTVVALLLSVLFRFWTFGGFVAW